MSALIERLKVAAYVQGYYGPALQCGGDDEDFRRGLTARLVAEWCGVSLAVRA